MKTLYLKSHATDINHIDIQVVERPVPILENDECLIKVHSSGINPSDALATTGYFKHAQAPRIPGRDFAGEVVAGPKQWLGKHVWGTGGAAGISSDGTQAEYIKLSSVELSEAPHNLDLVTAGAQTLPFVTAYYALAKRAHIKSGDTVLVVGALGQVGQAAMSICAWKNCNAIALVRGEEQLAKAKQCNWNTINSDEKNLKQKILAANNGKTVQVILNSVGNVYWQDFIGVLAELGRIVTIGARENFREATINLFELYRANQDLIGVNTVSFSFAENAAMLNELKVGFEEKKLTPLPIEQTAIYSPEQANQAYQAVMKASGKRIVIGFI